MRHSQYTANPLNPPYQGDFEDFAPVEVIGKCILISRVYYKTRETKSSYNGRYGQVDFNSSVKEVKVQTEGGAYQCAILTSPAPACGVHLGAGGQPLDLLLESQGHVPHRASSLIGWGCLQASALRYRKQLARFWSRRVFG